MAERFTSDLIFILVALLVSALLGYLIAYFCGKNKCNKLLKAKDLEIDNIKMDLGNSKQEVKKIKMELDSSKQELANLKRPFNANAAKEIFKAKIVENDLKIIEGIGEKIESILKNSGITTWNQLAQSNSDHIKEILLAEGGSGYQIHEPRTWPRQAQLAFEGKWKELKEYQDELKGGR